VPDDVEVLIVSFNSVALIERCLASIADVAPRLRVGIREHGNDPTTFERLRELVERGPLTARIEHDPSNPGFGAGCNALARGSSASWLLFLNPDTELLTWPWHRSPLPLSRIVGPTMVDSGHPGDHYGISYGLRDEIARSWLRRRGERPAGSGFVSAAALLIDAESFTRIGGFDESYFMYYEDIDLCERANALGIGTEVASDWILRHARAHSTRARFGESLVWSYQSGSRFHSSRGSSLGVYRAYVALDGALRSIVHLVSGDSRAARSYLSLARRAAGDLIRSRPATASAAKPTSSV
jgi:GT2 family glycosyltransferase